MKEVTVLNLVTTTLTNENLKLNRQNSLLDLQCRGMRDNLLFMGIAEKEKETYETSEAILKKVMQDPFKY